VPGREQGTGPGLPGGPAPGGPDGRVQALLAERPLDDGEGGPGPTVAVGRGDQPGRPAEQPRLDLRGHEQRDRPGPVERRVGRRPVGDPARKLDGEVDGVQGAHAGSFWVDDPALEGSCGSPGRTPGGGRDSGTGPGGRLASAGASRAPGPGTRAGPLQPRGEAGVAVQGALGGVPVRHAKARGCRSRPRLSSLTRSGVAFIRSQPSRAAAVAGSTQLIRVFRLWFGHLWCLRPPEHRFAGTRQAPGPSRSQAVAVSPGRT